MQSTQGTYDRMRREIIANTELVHWPLQLILGELEFGWKDRVSLPVELLGILRRETGESAAAHAVWEMLGGKAELVQRKLDARAQMIFAQVQEWVKGPVLDFGCGDGRVASLLSGDGHEVAMYDTADYRLAGTGLPFSTEWQVIRGSQFQTSLAITVFHHCDDPDREIRRLSHVCDRLVVIESVIDDSAMRWSTQALVDWVYNRGMHPGAEIPVPGQFRTVDEWRNTFVRYGFQVVHEEDLGIDLPIVPEHHYLFVLDRED
jgi:hypothetical protein